MSEISCFVSEILKTLNEYVVYSFSIVIMSVIFLRFLQSEDNLIVSICTIAVFSNVLLISSSPSLMCISHRFCYERRSLLWHVHILTAI